MHFEVKALGGQIVKISQRQPVQLRQSLPALCVLFLVAVPPKFQQPAQHARHHRRLDVQRAVGLQHPLEGLRHEAGRGHGHGQGRRNPAGVPARSSLAELALVNYDDVAVTAPQLIRGEEADDASA